MKNDTHNENSTALETNESLSNQNLPDKLIDSQPPITDVTHPEGESTGKYESKPVVMASGSRKKLAFGIVGIVIVTAAIVTGLVLYVLSLNSNPKPLSEADLLNAATKFDSAQALVNKIQPDLQGALIEVKDATGVSATDNSGNYAYGAPTYKTDGAPYSTLPLTVTGAAYTGDSVVAGKNYAALKNFFVANKFVERVSVADSQGKVSDLETVNYIAYAEYESSDLLCAIRHADASSTPLANHVAGVGCASKDSYVQATKLLQPFHKAYVDAGSDVSSSLVFGFLREKELTGGYKHAVVYIEDENQFDNKDEAEPLTGLYYQEPGQKDWTFFVVTDVDSLAVCSDFNTDVIKKAFSGYECYDDKSNRASTVK